MKSNKQVNRYPDGYENPIFVGKWFVAKNKNNPVRPFRIRRTIKKDGNLKKTQSLHISLYKEVFDTYNDIIVINDELKKICEKYNALQFGKSYLAKKKYSEIYKLSPWVTQSIRNKFENHLRGVIPTEKNSSYLFRKCEEQFLKYFIDIKKVRNPLEWHKYQVDWGKALRNEPSSETERIWDNPDFKPSKKTLKRIIQISNRFLKFLSVHETGMTDLRTLNPITKAQMKHYLATHKASVKKFRHFVSAEDFNTIIHKLETSLNYGISAYVKLAYYFGLRRSESIAINNEHLRKGYLSVEVQATGYNDDGLHVMATKAREKRKTPYWFISPDIAYEVVSMIGTFTMPHLHPDTLTSRFSKVISVLHEQGEIDKLYTFHDLRRTFITRALDNNSIKEVMMAVGHQNIETTMKYIVDDRKLDSDLFVPAA